ncbi:syntaxin binding protein 1 [Tieghemiomyces parasiticus]|uniref:Syntaxin binding protein 1 n=1 Tax=Tieghemiomyces parasiticus TaxID=78921 RepID=A0A9W8AHN6_9FUNG|nr:syntaxin binding protein 1 [Tieghemiomyces parasiticus]
MSQNQLKDLLKHKILGAIKKADGTSYAPKVIAVDDRSLSLLNSCVSNSEICTGGISAIVHINEPARPAPGSEVIYFVTPNPQVVNRICQDFSPRGKPASKGAPSSSGLPYVACHILFTYELDDGLFRQLTATIPTNSLKTLSELYVNFRVFEPLVFRTESSPQTFYNLFSPQVPERAPTEMEHMARQMVSLCASMHISPLIRYHQPDVEFNTCTLSRQLAMLFQLEFDKFLANHSDFEKTTDGQTVFLILDRTVDLFTPFLHEFTYQAMANDLLDIQNGRVYKYEAETGQGKVEKEAILDERDVLWMECRHKHIVDVKEILDKRQAELEKQNQFMTKKSEKTSVSHLRTVVGSMREYEKELGMFTAHHTMIHDCFVKFGQDRLPDLANLEQILVTGKTAEGEVMRNLEMEMFPLLDDPSISAMDKLRLLLLHFTAKNGQISSLDRQKLLQIANLGAKHRAAVENLTALGFQFDKAPPPSQQPAEDNLFGRLKQSFRARTAAANPQDEEAYNLSRYVPRLKKVIEDQLSGQLDSAEYPLVKPPRDQRAMQSAVPRKSLRTVKATWATPSTPGVATGSVGAGMSGSDMRRLPSQSTASGGRVVVFVVGGITYSEMRSVYELSSAFGWDVFLGSTHVFTPREFLHELSRLDEQSTQAIAPTGGGTPQSAAATAGPPPSTPTSRKGFFASRFGHSLTKGRDPSAPPTRADQPAASPASSTHSLPPHLSHDRRQPAPPAMNRYASSPDVNQSSPSSAPSIRTAAQRSPMSARLPPSSNDYRRGPASGSSSEHGSSASLNQSFGRMNVRDDLSGHGGADPAYQSYQSTYSSNGGSGRSDGRGYHAKVGQTPAGPHESPSPYAGRQASPARPQHHQQPSSSTTSLYRSLPATTTPNSSSPSAPSRHTPADAASLRSNHPVPSIGNKKSGFLNRFR